MADNVIEVRGLHKRYGDAHAVDGVDLAVKTGEMFGLIGHNGAGKSTLFKMMLGIVPATSGEIRIMGESVRGPGFRGVRRLIGYLPESLVLYDNLTGLETLHFFADLKGLPRAACAGVLDRVGLCAAAGRRVGTWSKGMRQRLGFAQALLGDPRLLFLDEPTSGLDPEATRAFYRLLEEMRRRGTTMVITSHVLAEIQQRVDRVAIMRAGRIEALDDLGGLRSALSLPVSIELRMRAGHGGEVHDALRALEEDIVRLEQDVLHVRCSRARRLAVIAALEPVHHLIADLEVREPSLEDVFFGWKDAGGRDSSGRLPDGGADTLHAAAPGPRPWDGQIPQSRMEGTR